MSFVIFIGIIVLIGSVGAIISGLASGITKRELSVFASVAVISVGVRP